MSVVLTERDGHVLIVTLNRPEARNAWNPALVHELRATWEMFAASEADRVCVVRGAGPLFTAGIDLKDTPADGFWGMPNLGVPCDKPILLAVEGAAIGYGSVMCLLADMVFAASDAYFLYPETRMGVFQGLMGGFPGRLQYKGGLQWLLTGDRLNAERAREIGLINEVIAPGQAFARALEVARTIAGHAPLVVQAIKALALNTVPKGVMEQNFHLHRSLDKIAQSHDAAEGLAAFREKRPTQFIGR